MKRLQWFGLAVTLVAVLVLTGSAVTGLFMAEDTPAASAEASPEEMVDGARLRVEVLNGAGVPGLAREVTRQLRSQNFDVVFFGNAPARRDHSVVIDRAGRLEDARRVAEALGIADLVSEPDTTLYLEATVVLGRDWGADERATEPDVTP